MEGIMENDQPYSESRIVEKMDPPLCDYFELSQIGITVDCKNLRFECNSKPIDTKQYYFSDRVIEQVISGDTDPIDNEKTLNNFVYSRQPYTNTIFKDKKFYIHIREQKRSENHSSRTNRHFLSSNYSSKNGQSTIFQWAIDDRSLFSRLCFLQSTSSQLFLTLRLCKDENYFKDLVDKGESKISKFISVEALHFHFK